MSQTSQCDTGTPSLCDLHQTLLELHLGNQHVLCTWHRCSQHRVICVLSLCGPAQKPWPSPQQSRGGCSTCQHCPTMQEDLRVFPRCSLLAKAAAVGVVRALQCCVSPKGFLSPLLRGGSVEPRAERSVRVSLICVFASLPACSRARCFSLLE